MGGGGRKRPPEEGARRVPSERRRTPGERTTSGRVRGTDPGYRLGDPAMRRRGSLEAAPERLRLERDTRRKRTKRVAAIAAIVVGVLLLAVVGTAAGWAYHLQKTVKPKTLVEQKELQDQLAKAKPQEPYNLLLLGVDARPDEKAYRTDTIIFVHINPQTKQVWMMSIPRDTKVSIPGHGEDKINAAHFYGGAPLTVKTVKQFVGLPVNHYMEVNFWAFEGAVNALGGVWINVPKAINDPKAARSPRHRAAKVPAGYQLLDGEHALTFVRSRKYVDADWSRMKNQQAFMKAFADQMAKTQNIARIPGVVSSIAPYLKTDMGLVEMVRTAQSLHDAGGKNIHTATLTGTWKSPFVYPSTKVLNKLVGDIKAERSFEGTKSTSPTSTAPVGPGGTPVKAKKPSQISVTVRNGSGVGGVAKQASSILKAQGFKIGETGNAGQNVYKQTLIVYKDDLGSAQVVAQSMPPGTKLVQSRGMYAFTTDVLVVVGKDWDVSKVPAAQIQTQ